MNTKTLIWGYLILFFWCAVIIIVALFLDGQSDSDLAEKAFTVASEGFKVVIAAAIGTFSALAGNNRSDNN